jgi:thioredoxin reductase
MASIPRRQFILLSAQAAAALALPLPLVAFSKHNPMKDKNIFDVIIVGGSYSGLAAAMALGRASMNVLVIDSGKPCNRQTPYSHNFLTQDGVPPAEIAQLAKKQVKLYGTVKFIEGLAVSGAKTTNGFEIQIASGAIFKSGKLVFATGIRDLMPGIPGYSECWGISVLHCPYCHGYEVRNKTTGILANGDHAFELAKLISNWTTDLTVYTNGQSTLTTEQAQALKKHRIHIVEEEVARLDHTNGNLRSIMFRNGSHAAAKALYVRSPFEQHCSIPQSLGCELTGDGYIEVDPLQETSVKGVFACGDNTTRMRTVANAVAMGTTAGMTASKKLILERFKD